MLKYRLRPVPDWKCGPTSTLTFAICVPVLSQNQQLLYANLLPTSTHSPKPQESRHTLRLAHVSSYMGTDNLFESWKAFCSPQWGPWWGPGVKAPWWGQGSKPLGGSGVKAPWWEPGVKAPWSWQIFNTGQKSPSGCIEFYAAFSFCIYPLFPINCTKVKISPLFLLPSHTLSYWAVSYTHLTLPTRMVV